MASLLLFCWIRRNNPKRKEALELIEVAMVGVNERLKKRGYFVPCQSGERRIYFVFLLLTFVDCKHSKKCTFYTLRFGCSFAAVNTIKPQLL